IGINAEIEVIEWGIWLDNVFTNHEYDITAIEITGRPSPFEILGNYQSDNDARNFYRFDNEEYDNVLKEASLEVESDKQIEYSHRAQEILNEEAVASYIADPQTLWVHDSNLTGLKAYPFWFHDMKEVKFE